MVAQPCAVTVLQVVIICVMMVCISSATLLSSSFCFVSRQLMDAKTNSDQKNLKNHCFSTCYNFFLHLLL